jgi:hypothetical protein
MQMRKTEYRGAVKVLGPRSPRGMHLWRQANEKTGAMVPGAHRLGLQGSGDRREKKRAGKETGRTPTGVRPAVRGQLSLGRSRRRTLLGIFASSSSGSWCTDRCPIRRRSVASRFHRSPRMPCSTRVYPCRVWVCKSAASRDCVVGTATRWQGIPLPRRPDGSSCPGPRRRR